MLAHLKTDTRHLLLARQQNLKRFPALMTTQLSPESDAKLSANYVSSSCFKKSKVRSRPIISRRRKRQLGCLAARAAAFLPINQKVKRKTLTMTRSIYVFESCPFCQTCVRSLHWDSRRGWIVWREPAHLPRFFTFWKGVHARPNKIFKVPLFTSDVW